ncbi:MAG: 30S ribosome-binding factor RbfA [Myxococcaceae bacterium]|jgi:ribosome-binding factor A|nr:30S ribosome-binding factor RbfA [Myxococcaceae bacterium]MCA3013021.1 30S ribosome-binding factor RbfA [Myxococcaceae bacterium]
MGSNVRPERVGQEIQAAVADMLTRGDLHDPRIGYITITGVKVSPDLRVARIYYSMIGTEEEKARTKDGLEAAKGYVRREVTSRVKLRVSPEVFFTFDGSLEEGDKIERLLKEVKAKEGW